MGHTWDIHPSQSAIPLVRFRPDLCTAPEPAEKEKVSAWVTVESLPDTQAKSYRSLAQAKGCNCRRKTEARDWSALLSQTSASLDWDTTSPFALGSLFAGLALVGTLSRLPEFSQMLLWILGRCCCSCCGRHFYRLLQICYLLVQKGQGRERKNKKKPN